MLIKHYLQGPGCGLQFVAPVSDCSHLNLLSHPDLRLAARVKSRNSNMLKNKNCIQKVLQSTKLYNAMNNYRGLKIKNLEILQS